MTTENLTKQRKYDTLSCFTLKSLQAFTNHTLSAEVTTRSEADKAIEFGTHIRNLCSYYGLKELDAYDYKPLPKNGNPKT